MFGRLGNAEKSVWEVAGKKNAHFVWVQFFSYLCGEIKKNIMI